MRPQYVLLEVRDDEDGELAPVVRGTFATRERALAAVARELRARRPSYGRTEGDRTQRRRFHSKKHPLLLRGVAPAGPDADRFATDEVLVDIWGSEQEAEPTDFFVWSSEKARARKLYWCSTADHDEDWFIVGRSDGEARKRHASLEGYEVSDVRVVQVAVLPNELQGGENPGPWPDDATIEACGGQWLRRETPRVVCFGETEYAEGLLEHALQSAQDDQTESVGQGRGNGTRRHDA